MQELAEDLSVWPRTRRTHLVDDLDKVIRRNAACASVGRAITNSHPWLEDIVDAFRFLGGEAACEGLYATIYARGWRICGWDFCDWRTYGLWRRR
jgi:hypothetical protein